MAARINNFPTNLVWDRSTLGEASTTGSINPITTGTASNMFDKSTTTFYQVESTGGATSAARIIIDFQRTFWNVQLFVKYYCADDGAGGSNGLEYSLDGSSWTTISNDFGEQTKSANLLQCRYIRLYQDDSGGAHVTAKIYECLIMGSG